MYHFNEKWTLYCILPSQVWMCVLYMCPHAHSNLNGGLQYVRTLSSVRLLSFWKPLPVYVRHEALIFLSQYYIFHTVTHTSKEAYFSTQFSFSHIITHIVLLSKNW